MKPGYITALGAGALLASTAACGGATHQSTPTSTPPSSTAP
jgi:hypothetical protein